MILIVTTGWHLYTHKCLESESELEVRVISYAQLAGYDPAPVATYVLTDIDRLAPPHLLEIAETYAKLRNLGRKVLNNPAKMRSRFGLLRALNRAGINDFDAYRAEDLETPRRWPVFLRVEGTHAEPVSPLLKNEAELAAAIDRCVKRGLPRSALLIIEYAAEPVRPGLFRKLSAFRVGGRLLGYTSVHDDQWLVKYGKPAIAPPELYEEEYQFVVKAPFADTLRKVFDIAGIEYGRVDYGLVGGRPQIYEINSNPNLDLNPEPGPVARRNESNNLFKVNYLAAMKAIDTKAVEDAVDEKVETNAAT